MKENRSITREHLIRAEANVSARRIPELDGIRAVAILLVIGCHYQGFAALLWGLPSFGWIGVDIFFVLSGFLITSILLELRGTESPLKVFYVRRVLRIFPVYYLLIPLVAAISLALREHLIHFGWFVSRFLFLQSLRDSPALIQQAWSELMGRESRVYLFHRVLLPESEPGAILGPWANSLSAAWSLSIEEYFYILWAPIVIFLKGREKVVLCASLIFGVAIVIQYLGFSGLENYFEFLCRIDTIMSGAILALFLKWKSQLPPHRHQLVNKLALATGGLITLVLAGAFIWNRPVIGHELRDSPCFMVIGLPSISILFALVLGWIVQHHGKSFFLLRALRVRPARYLGTISYSLYLFHIPVYFGVLAVAQVFARKGRMALFEVSTAALLISIALSALSWRFFETPVLMLKERWAPTEASVRAALIVS